MRKIVFNTEYDFDVQRVFIMLTLYAKKICPGLIMTEKLIKRYVQVLLRICFSNVFGIRDQIQQINCI